MQRLEQIRAKVIANNVRDISAGLVRRVLAIIGLAASQQPPPSIPRCRRTAPRYRRGALAGRSSPLRSQRLATHCQSPRLPSRARMRTSGGSMRASAAPAHFWEPSRPVYAKDHVADKLRRHRVEHQSSGMRRFCASFHTTAQPAQLAHDLFGSCSPVHHDQHSPMKARRRQAGPVIC